MKRIFLSLAISTLVLFGLSTATPGALAFACSQPSNVSITYHSGGRIDFDWDSCEGGCSSYGVQYYRRQDNYWSQKYQTGSSAYSFANLSSGNYNFYFTTICGETESQAVVIEEIIVN